MRTLKKTGLLIPGLFIAAGCFAQNNSTGMADMMRSNGRIYVVVAVMVTILAGLIFYVARLDRKISSLEKK
jgi:uncharacterized membrane protein